MSNFKCESLSSTVNFGLNDFSVWGQTGWICPKCGRVNAPWKGTCDCYRDINTISTDKTYTLPNTSTDAEHSDEFVRWSKQCGFNKNSNSCDVNSAKKNSNCNTKSSAISHCNIKTKI